MPGADAFEYGDHAGVADELGDRRLRNLVRCGEHAAVEVEPHDARHHVGGRDVRGHVELVEVGVQLLDPALHAEQRPHRIRRLDEPAHHDGSLRDHEPTPARPVGPAVGGREVAELVEPRVPDVVGVDQLH